MWLCIRFEDDDLFERRNFSILGNSHSAHRKPRKIEVFRNNCMSKFVWASTDLPMFAKFSPTHSCLLENGKRIVNPLESMRISEFLKGSQNFTTVFSPCIICIYNKCVKSISYNEILSSNLVTMTILLRYFVIWPTRLTNLITLKVEAHIRKWFRKLFDKRKIVETEMRHRNSIRHRKKLNRMHSKLTPTAKLKNNKNPR